MNESKNTHQRLPRKGSQLVLALALVSLSSYASAQSYYRRDLMDYDQRRNALAGNGKNHCVPTAYVDIFRFMAVKAGLGGLDHGYNGGYGDITSFINHMGNLMDTDPDSGTNFDDGVEGAAEWIAAHSNAFYVHVTFGPGSNWGINRLQNTAANGYMARIGYSKWFKDGSTWERKGGHALALAGYDFRTSDKKIIVANPWTGNDDSINAQSTFNLQRRTVENIQINTDDYGKVTHARWDAWTKDGVQWQAMIDKMHVIIPVWGGWVNAPFTTAPPELLASINSTYGPVTGAATTFHAEFPGADKDSANPAMRSRDIELPGPVKDWCMDPGQAAIYVLLEDGTVHHVNILDRKIDRVTSIRGARKLTVAGKNLELFVLQDGDRDDNLIRLDVESGKQTTMKVAKGITAIEPDQETLGVAALHPTSKRVFRIDKDLKVARPLTVNLPEGTGAVLLNMGRKGEITLARTGTRGFTRASGGTARKFTIAQNSMTRSLQAIGKDRFLVQDGERLIAIDANGKPFASAFDKIRATGLMRLSPSWRTVTKAESSSPKWRETPPDADGH